MTAEFESLLDTLAIYGVNDPMIHSTGHRICVSSFSYLTHLSLLDVVSRYQMCCREGQTVSLSGTPGIDR